MWKSHYSLLAKKKKVKKKERGARKKEKGKKNCLTEENSSEMYKIVTGASDKKSVIEYNDLLSECHRTKCQWEWLPTKYIFICDF